MDTRVDTWRSRIPRGGAGGLDVRDRRPLRLAPTLGPHARSFQASGVARIRPTRTRRHSVGPDGGGGSRGPFGPAAALAALQVRLRRARLGPLGADQPPSGVLADAPREG